MPRFLPLCFLPPRCALPLAAALPLVAVLLLSACGEAPAPGASSAPDSDAARSESQKRGAALIDSARAAAGSERLDGAHVRFTFRGDRFDLRHAENGFSYGRTYRDSLGRRVQDVLTGDTLRRRIEGRRISLPAGERRQARTAVNSVAYFALLPEPLGDPAVRPRYTGADTLCGVPYHRVAVRFRQKGGGRDWQDRFLYWFDQRDFSMDYLAYAYGLAGGEDYGTRFREAFNTRRRGGVRFADYRNYTARTDSLPPGALSRYARLLEVDSLRRVSTVALDSVRVRPLDD